MTKAKALREYFKKVYNFDLSGMSSIAVIKDIFKKKYNIDANGSTVSSILMNSVDQVPSGGIELKFRNVTVNNTRSEGTLLENKVTFNGIKFSSSDGYIEEESVSINGGSSKTFTIAMPIQVYDEHGTRSNFTQYYIMVTQASSSEPTVSGEKVYVHGHLIKNSTRYTVLSFGGSTQDDIAFTVA